jgi:tungstate transport system permease protein
MIGLHITAVGGLMQYFEALAEALYLIFSLDPEVWGIMILSIRVSGTATFLAACCGIPLGMFLGLRVYIGHRIINNLVNTAMGLPPVVIGLYVFLMLSRSGPLGFLSLLYTPTAMIIAQWILATPIVTGITMAAVRSVQNKYRDTALSLGATEPQLWLTILKEARISIMAGICVAFGQAISEVGAIMIVGGNIRFSTRAMTTAIVLQTRMGIFGMAIALGIILIGLAFLVNLIFTTLQEGTEVVR